MVGLQPRSTASAHHVPLGLGLGTTPDLMVMVMGTGPQPPALEAPPAPALTATEKDEYIILYTNQPTQIQNERLTHRSGG